MPKTKWAAIAVTVLALAGCGTAATSSSNSASSTSPSTSAPSQPAPQAGVGTTFTISTTHLGGDPWYTLKIKLDKVTEPAQPDPEAGMPDGTNLAAAKEGYHIAAAQFTWVGLTSDDGKGITPSGLMEFSAKGSDGHRYSAALGVGAGNGIDNEQPDLEEPATGTVSFEVPNGVHIISVRYSAVGGGDSTWMISR